MKPIAGNLYRTTIAVPILSVPYHQLESNVSKGLRFRFAFKVSQLIQFPELKTKQEWKLIETKERMVNEPARGVKQLWYRKRVITKHKAAYIDRKPSIAAAKKEENTQKKRLREKETLNTETSRMREGDRENNPTE